MDNNKKSLSIFKKIDLVRNIISVIFYLFFLSFNLRFHKGHELINKILLVVTVAYFIFLLILIAYDANGKNKYIRKTGTRVYKYIKRFMLLISAFMTIFTIISIHDEHSWVQATGAIFTIFNLVMQILLDIIITKFSKLFASIKDNIKGKFSRFINKKANNEELPSGETNDLISDNDNNYTKIN